MRRRIYKGDEERYPWLTILLDTYEISDSLIDDHIKRIGQVACKKGCSNCCKNPMVPITEPELAGISWYTSEKLKEPIRSHVKTRLYSYKTVSECPFLVGDECSIHVMRPLICRQFYIIGKPCLGGEDVSITRPQDIVLPNRVIAKASAMRLLDYWGMKTTYRKEKAFEDGFIVINGRNMRECDLKFIVTNMEAFENVT